MMRLLLVAYSLTTVAAGSDLRGQILQLYAKHPHGHLDPAIREEVQDLLVKYHQTPDADHTDVVFGIGEEIYGAHLPKLKYSEENPVIISFDYMKAFMNDVFLSYGVTEEHAEIASDVLIESDRRGIDSHGLGRLKPIYCDRMDAGTYCRMCSMCLEPCFTHLFASRHSLAGPSH